MRTIGNLLKHNGRVYVYFANRNLSKLFLKYAEEEGFTFGDGMKPTRCETSDILAINDDWTINYVGWAGHAAFSSAAKIGGKPLVRVHYGKYLAGNEQYLI